MSENTRQLGLFHHLSFSEREQIVDELAVLYVDIYDALESTRDNVRSLEDELDRLFYGSSREGDIEVEGRAPRRFR